MATLTKKGLTDIQTVWFQYGMVVGNDEQNLTALDPEFSTVYQSYLVARSRISNMLEKIKADLPK